MENPLRTPLSNRSCREVRSMWKVGLNSKIKLGRYKTFSKELVFKSILMWLVMLELARLLSSQPSTKETLSKSLKAYPNMSLSLTTNFSLLSM